MNEKHLSIVDNTAVPGPMVLVGAQELIRLKGQLIDYLALTDPLGGMHDPVHGLQYIGAILRAVDDVMTTSNAGGNDASSLS